jgi:hypothetical protein
VGSAIGESSARVSGSSDRASVTDLGHEEPTLILTNQLRKSAAKIIERCARRMLIENGIADGVEFYHMDALSSAVAMKIDCDLQLTLMAGSLYRLLASKIAEGYETATSTVAAREMIGFPSAARGTSSPPRAYTSASAVVEPTYRHAAH